jgi:hypothetical protein
MNSKRMIVLSIVGALALAGLLLAATGAWARGDARSSAAALAQAGVVSGTISYQGRLLNADGTPVEGMHTMAFRVYAQASGGTPLWSDSFPVPVEEGLFHVMLDVDPALFDGRALWLGVQVEGDAEEMTPRQPLLPAPYALYALSAPWTGLTGVPTGLGDGDDDTTYTAGTGLGLADTQFIVSVSYRLPQSCGIGEIAEWNGSSWGCGGDDDTNYTAGTGLSLVDTQFRVNTSYRLPQSCSSGQIAEWNGSSWQCGDDDTGTGGGGWSLTGNSGTDPTTDFLGTTDGVSLTLAVSGASALRLEPNSFSPNLIGGYGGNSVAPGVDGAVVGGGGHNFYSNQVTADYGTVGGGEGNNVTAFAGTVGGGSSNTASGGTATVGGGYSNTASGDYATVGGGWGNVVTATCATVSGGSFNAASGEDATVGGGYWNNVEGDYATIPGGYRNTASGNYSFVAGERASAGHGGCFVWSSYTETLSWGPNTFTARAHGGARFYSGAGTGTGVQLSSGGSSWASISDRDAKENFADVDAGQVLETLAAMPIQTWNLKAQSPDMRHIGPVAQDFNGQFAYLFGEVESPTHVNNMDAIGVAMVAVQGLYAQNQELTAENAALRVEVDNLEARVAALEAAVGTSPASGQVSGGWLSFERLGTLLLGGLVAVVAVVRRRRSPGGGL